MNQKTKSEVEKVQDLLASARRGLFRAKAALGVDDRDGAETLLTVWGKLLAADNDLDEWLSERQ